jgi:anti-sigma regulatory factor (Ser/Thr protein kinase)
MLTLDSVAELSIRAEVSEVRRASAWLAEQATRHALPEEALTGLDLCLNEALANVLAHGGPSARSASIDLCFEVEDEAGRPRARLTVADAGTPFDPLAYVQQPRPQSLAEAEPGGLGLMMMRNFAERLDYSYRDGRNRLSFGVSWSRPG